MQSSVLDVTQDHIAEVWRAFELCEGTASRTFKKQVLRDLSEGAQTFAKWYFDQVMNPFHTYGIVPSLPALTVSHPFDFYTLQLLCTSLQKRELTGGSAQTTVTQYLAGLEPLAQKWIHRMFLRDTKMGVSWGTVTELWGKYIPSFEMQKANPAPKQIPAGDWLVEPKMDGVRGIFIVSKDGTVIGLSSNGKPVNNTEDIEKELVQFVKNASSEALVFDGELLADDWNKTSSITRTQGEHPLRDTLTFHCFDVMTKREWDTQTSRPLSERKRILESMNAHLLRKVITIQGIKCDDPVAIRQLAEQFFDQGYEGAVIKRINSPYEWARTDNWLKIKFEETMDGEIMAAYIGTGRNSQRLGGFTVRTENGTIVNVGGAYSDAQREEFWLKKSEYIGKWLEFKRQRGEGITISSRFPNFVRMREDK